MKARAIALAATVLLLGLLASAESKTMKATGWVSDSMCAAKGDKKCSNKDHLKQGAKLVIVADLDNKVWVVQDASKVGPFQGQHIRFSAVARDQNTLDVKSVTKEKEIKQ